MAYIIIIGLDNPIYAQIAKCERSGQNLMFYSFEEAQGKADALDCNALVIAV